jgi:hypothetical protein
VGRAFCSLNRQAIALQVLRAEHELTGCESPGERAGIEERIRLWQVCRDAVEVFDELRSFKVVGFEASRPVFTTLLTASVSFFSTLVLVYGTRGDALISQVLPS